MNSEAITEIQRERRNASSLKYYYSHKDKVQKRNDAWWKEHPEKLKEKWKRNRNRRKEKLREYRKKYRLTHREQLREASKRWKKTKAGKACVLRNVHLRRARIYASSIDTTGISKWMKEIKSNPFARCHWCGTKVSGDQIHFDHVISLSGGGSHTIGNLCASCSECNQSKSSKAICDWIARGQTFLSL